MVDLADFLAAIDEVYRLRVAGDKAALMAHLAPDAQFHLVGEATLMPMVATGPGLAAPTIESLIDTFVFHTHERLDAIVEGDKAAVLTRITVSRPDGPRVTTVVYDLWTMGPDGRLASLLQFADTALVAHLMGRGAGAAADVASA
jgi:ketosteroid isomerase-like protein